MNKKLYALLLICLLTVGFASAQSLNLFYQIKSGTQNVDTVVYYLQNSSSNNLQIRAANFSIAFETTSGLSYNPAPNNCIGRDSVMYLVYSWFNTIWTPPFTEACAIQNSQSLSYNGNGYNARYSYGISDFSFVGPPNPLNVDPTSGNPIVAMKIAFDNSLIARVYPENQSENISNQMGDINFAAIPYSLQVLGAGFPVEWAGFEAKSLGEQQVQLNWQTAMEINTAYFEVEKSFSGNFADAQAIGQLQAQGFTDSYTNYAFTDYGQMAHEMYYRIKNVDLDGSVTYSHVVQVKQAKLAPTFNLHPNPVRGLLFIQPQQRVEVDASFMLRDIQGNVLKQAHHRFEITSGHAARLDLSDLPAGIYLLEIKDEQDISSFQRVVKQ